MATSTVVLVAVLLCGASLVTGGPVEVSALPVTANPQSDSQCPDGWTLQDGECYLPAVDFADSWDAAQILCENMGTELATVMPGDSTIFDLSLGGAIHVGSQFWVQQDLTMASSDGSSDTSTSNISPRTNCSYVSFTASGDTEFGMAPCDTDTYGYLCVIDPSTYASNQSSTLSPDDPNGELSTPLYDANATPDVEDDDVPKEPDTAVGVPLTMPELPAVSITATCSDPWFLSPTGESCYFFAPTFSSGNFFQTSAFCQSLGGAIVEPITLDEFNAVSNISASYEDVWTDGPWIGLVRLFNDSRLVFPSTLTSPEEYSYRTNLTFSLEQQNITADQNCAGFSSGATFGVWDCNSDMGTPFCEKDLQISFDVVAANLGSNKNST